MVTAARIKNFKRRLEAGPGPLSELFERLDEFSSEIRVNAEQRGEELTFSNHLEACLAGTLMSAVYAKFKDLPESAREDDVIELAYLYTILSRHEFFDPYDLGSLFLDHLKYRWQKQHSKKFEQPLDPKMTHQLMSLASLLPGQVALLFGVQKRQVRRWIQRGLLTKGPDGRIGRENYLQFARNSETKKYGREEYSRVIREFNRLKIVTAAPGRISITGRIALTAPSSKISIIGRVSKSKQKPAPRRGK